MPAARSRTAYVVLVVAAVLVVFGVLIGAGATNAAVYPVSEFGIALVIRSVFFLAVAVGVAWVADRLRALEHSAEELEAIRAARLATFVRARFAAFAANTSDPAELLMLANTALADRPGRQSQLISAICVRLGPDEGRLSWARAGHPAPLCLPDLSELAADGATDVRQGHQMLGLDGLRKVLAPLAGLSSRVIAQEIERAILAWADRPIRDDFCLVVLKAERVDR